MSAQTQLAKEQKAPEREKASRFARVPLALAAVLLVLVLQQVQWVEVLARVRWVRV